MPLDFICRVRTENRKNDIINIDGSVKSPKTVIPAKAGIQNILKTLDSRFHGNDKKEKF
jgi:hypothetical protein